MKILEGSNTQIFSWFIKDNEKKGQNQVHVQALFRLCLDRHEYFYDENHN